MKRVVLLHTVQSVCASFGERVREAVPELELKIHNMLDEFLAADAAPEEHGHFTARNNARLRLALRSAAMTDADLIVVTCSQLSAAARRLARQTPLVTIDEAMLEQAVLHGPKIALLSTAEGSVAPVRQSLEIEAARQRRHIEIRAFADERAIRALKAGDVETHDRLVRELAAQVGACDVAILAQASAAHMEREVAAITGLLTFSSPALCLARIRERLLAAAPAYDGEKQL